MSTGDAGLPDNVIVDVLNQCREMIVTNLSSFNSVMDHIVTKDIFTEVELRDFTELPTTSDKIRKLITLIKSKGSKEYGAFLSALSATKQEHLLGNIKAEESKFHKYMEHAPVQENSSSNIKYVQPQRECSDPSTRDGDATSPGHSGSSNMTDMDKNQYHAVNASANIRSYHEGNQ